MQRNTKKTKELNILYITMDSAIFIERQNKGGGDIASSEAAQITVSRNGFNLFLL